MILTVFGATGQVGKRIVSYALAKGHTVRAFGRNINELIDADLQNERLEAIKGSVFDEEEVYEAVNGANAVLSALGGAFDGTDKTRSLGIKTICKQMKKAEVKRIVALGGLGVLNAPDDTYLIDQPDYPIEYVPVGREHLKAFENLEQSDLDWTFVCSPDIRNMDATDNYITSETYPPSPNKYFIAAGDIAHFMVDEAQAIKHSGQRVGMSSR